MSLEELMDMDVTSVAKQPEPYGHPRRRCHLLSRTISKAAGCAAYLMKPINTRELSSQLTAVAERGNAVN